MGWLEGKASEMPPIKCLVLGDYGTGKSWFAGTFPDPIFVLDFDSSKIGYMAAVKNGKKVFIYDDMLDASKPIQQRWSMLVRDLDSVVLSDEFKTIVFDSTTSGLEWCMELATSMKPLPPNSPPVWNVHYPLVKTFIHQLLSRFRKFKGNVVCISHVEYEKDDLTGEIRALPSLQGKLKQIVPGYFDEVYFADIAWRRDKSGKASREYVLHLVPQGYKRARSRLRGVFNLPETIPNTYKALKEV